MMKLLQFLTVACSLLQLLKYSQADEKIDDWIEGDPKLEPSCKSWVYCEGELLHDVQLSNLFEDSKEFVDMPLRYPEAVIAAHYRELKNAHQGRVPPAEELKPFVERHMVADGQTAPSWTLPDINDRPPVLARVRDPLYAGWVLRLVDMWPQMAMAAPDGARTRPDMYSVLWVPNGFVAPGGRFRELYYWDTYWIVGGLLLCGMNVTVRGMIDNVAYLVRRHGYMPNGGRVYYLNRSQPPMFIPMALSYYEATGDFEYIREILPELETEFGFWMKNRMITFQKDGKSYTMARYYAPSRGPRPESYKEDYNMAKKFKTQEEKENFYTNIKSGAETGWDFSGRWFITSNGSNSGDLSDIQTTSIVPVDLNCFLHMNARTLCTWFNRIGNQSQKYNYCEIEREFLNNIREVMWRPDKGAWFDWDLKNHKHREYFYVSNIVPLWTESYDMPKDEVANLVLSYLMSHNIIESDYTIKYNGTPTSLYYTSQQWDYPNGWPALQAFIIQGLVKTGQSVAHKVAAELANVWLRMNYKHYLRHVRMYEKYQVLGQIDPSLTKDGEYSTQTGFGWTNGVVLELLNMFGDTVTYQ